MIKESIDDLRKICQHSYFGWSSQPWVFLQVRKLSIYLTWVLLHTTLSSNAISLLGIGSGVLAAVLFGQNLLAHVIVRRLEGIDALRGRLLDRHHGGAMAREQP